MRARAGLRIHAGDGRDGAWDGARDDPGEVDAIRLVPAVTDVGAVAAVAAGPGSTGRPAAGSVAHGPGPVTIDCDTCTVRGIGCGDCVVALLLGPPDGVLTLGRGQARALGVLAGSGLVPPLRHSSGTPGSGSGA